MYYEVYEQINDLSTQQFLNISCCLPDGLHGAYRVLTG